MMYCFLFLLVFGFACNLGSAFTTAFSRRWGERHGSLISAILRNILGIPVWMIGFILAARTPSSELFALDVTTTLVGWLLITVGGMIILIALVTMRFRAAKPSIQDKLAQSGIYAYMRHPIHAGTLLEFIGLVLIVPILTMALACGLGIVWVLIQTWLEEIDLLQRMPGYREYMNVVPRFFPKLRGGR
jgi:protein-S-isoprenylcysteine O-methyltransferase Ste14